MIVYRVIKEFRHSSVGKPIPTGSVVYTDDDLSGWIAVSPPSTPDPLTHFVGGVEVIGVQNLIRAGLIERHGQIAVSDESEEEVLESQEKPLNLGLSTSDEMNKPVLRAAPQPNRPGYVPCDRYVELHTATPGDSFSDTKIHLATMQRRDWGEVRHVGCFREDKGKLVKCPEGADESVMSVWDFQPNDQTPEKTPINWDLKECIVSVREKGEGKRHIDIVLAPEVHPHRGGVVRLVSGIVNGYGDSVGVSYPAALQLDAESRPRSSAVRVFISHPLGSKETYVLRLATYRRLGTF
jgi:hypothetical protein